MHIWNYTIKTVFCSFSSYRCFSNITNNKNMSSNIVNKFVLPSRYADSVYSVWIEFSELAAKVKPINLGQGFPDYPPPEYVTSMLSEIALSASENPLLHQYTRGFGHPRLVNAIAKLYSKLVNQHLDPFKNIIITCGAYEALYSIINGHVETGDEVIIIEPYFDCYEPMVICAGGTARFIPLRNVSSNHTGSGDTYSDSWKLDEQELTSLFNSKTKMMILNTPNNPLGKVFSLDELKFIADLCIKHNVLCVSDEVYEWMVYEPKKHIRIATLPGMWERTITVGSAGKSFSVTGWKCGWAYGPEYLIKNASIIHQNNVYTYNTPIQEAIARCFEKEMDRFDSPECYFKSVSKELILKRDYFVNVLKSIGLTPTIPDAGYFLVANWSTVGADLNLSSEQDQYKDFRFAKWMSKNIKVQGIPPSVFYSKENKYIGEELIRYCFFKKDETLKAAAEKLLKWKHSLGSNSKI